MISRKTFRKAAAIGSVLTGSQLVSAADDAASIIASIICGLVPQVVALAEALAVVMFLYGGAKYAYSADDPGGRKQAKSIAVNALLGMIIVGASYGVVLAISGESDLC